MATMTFWTVSARRQTVLARSRRSCWRRCNNSSNSNSNNSSNNKNRLALTSTMDYSSSRSSSRSSCASGLTMLPNRLSVKTKNHVLACSLATAAKATVLNNDNDNDYSNDSNNDTNKDTVIPFLLADIGEGIKEVELLTWYVQAGDTVQEFDAVCQVQSDKATVDITSRYAGVVTQLGAAVGEFVQVGKPLLFLNSTTTTTATRNNESKNHNDKDNTDTHPSMSSLPSLAEQMAADAETNWQEDRLSIPKMATHYTLEHDHQNASMPLHKVLTSPAVRKMAAEHEIDLKTLRGSGPQGRILKQDVLQYIRQQHPSAPQVTKKTPSAETQETSVSMSLPPAATAATMALPQESSEIIQLKGYSRSMVHTMTAALQIPHMTLGDEVQLDRILQLRKEWKHNDSANMGNSNQNNNNNLDVSVLAFMLKACSLALTEFPILNASIHDLETCQVQVHHHHHIGVAMDTPRGLLVPAIQFVQQKSLLDIQNDLNALKDQAKNMTGGGGGVDSSVLNPTFTLSNIGALGVGQTMSAVLAPPQVAMGAVGRMQRIPRFTSDHNDASGNGDKSMQVLAVQVANVSWTADHRVVDGATLARFHQRFASYLEDPTRMLWHCK